MGLLHEADQARRCLKAAERVAGDCGDWCICGYNWPIVPGSYQDSLRCLNTAESLATTASDWRECADSWNVVGNPERQFDCLRKITDQ